jgi:hypothetical protein
MVGDEEEVSDHDVSWVTVKKRKVASAVPTNNRFAPLSDNSAKPSDAVINENDNEVIMNSDEPVPPAFYIEGVDQIEGMVKKFSQLAGEGSFKYVCQRDGTIKVNSKKIETYKILTKFLKDKNIAFHTYQVRSERSFNVVVSGLHRTYKIPDLCYYLKENGHTVRSAAVMQRRVYDQESQTSSRVDMDKFIVHLEPSPNNKEVYKLKYLDHCVIKVEPPYKRESNGVPPLCSNCQRRGHTRNYCYRLPRCVKCGEGHSSSQCTLPKTEKPTCANCGLHHTANFGGCEDYQKRITKRRVAQNNRPEYTYDETNFAPLRGQRPSPANAPFNGTTFAETTRNGNTLERLELLMERQLKTIDSLMTMMTTLVNNLLCRK